VNIAPLSGTPEAGVAEEAGRHCRRGTAHLLGFVFLLIGQPAAWADCRLELELLGQDLKGLALSEPQKLRLAPLVDDALKRCRLGWEAAALAYIDKARDVAGIVRPADALGDPPGDGPVR
jgi:hypothetical protein